MTKLAKEQKKKNKKTAQNLEKNYQADMKKLVKSL
jgi:hypothetical protein